MTIDEAIKHQEEKTEALYKAIPCDGCAFDECVKEHRQLAEWLNELKAWRTFGLRVGEIISLYLPDDMVAELLKTLNERSGDEE